MIHRQTLNALRTRAIMTASDLEYWARELSAELHKQNIDVYGPKGASDLLDDDQLPVSITRGHARRLIRHMRERAVEIRKFSN
jgi:hypothetical protein